MEQHPGDGPRGPASDLNPELVAGYLRRHPDFLVERPDLAAALRPPPRELGPGVVDLQSFVLERMRTDMARLRLTQRKLLATSRNNLASQGRVHAAVLALLGAQSFEHLVTVITEDLAGLLDVDAVGLCLESNAGGQDRLTVGDSALQIVGPGLIESLLNGGDVVLRADVVGDPRLFGGSAELVRSDVLARLSISASAPPGLLALGARRPGMFHPDQGAELVTFLAKVIEHVIRTWLDLPR